MPTPPSHTPASEPSSKSATQIVSVAALLVVLPHALVTRQRLRIGLPSKRIWEYRKVALCEPCTVAIEWPLRESSPSARSDQTPLPSGADSICQAYELAPPNATKKSA